MVKRKYINKNKNKNINNNKINIHINTHKKSHKKRNPTLKKYDEHYRPTTIINNLPTQQPNYDMIHNFRNDIDDMKVKLNSFQNNNIPVSNSLAHNIPQRIPMLMTYKPKANEPFLNDFENPEEKMSESRSITHKPKQFEEDNQDTEHKKDALSNIIKNYGKETPEPIKGRRNSMTTLPVYQKETFKGLKSPKNLDFEPEKDKKTEKYETAKARKDNIKDNFTVDNYNNALEEYMSLYPNSKFDAKFNRANKTNYVDLIGKINKANKKSK